MVRGNKEVPLYEPKRVVPRANQEQFSQVGEKLNTPGQKDFPQRGENLFPQRGDNCEEPPQRSRSIKATEPHQDENVGVIPPDKRKTGGRETTHFFWGRGEDPI